jgi:hypothetical protein
MRVRVRPILHVYGFEPGQEVEIDLDQKVRDLIQAGYLLLLRPKSHGQNVPE